MISFFTDFFSYVINFSSFVLTLVEGLTCMLLLTFAYKRRKIYILRLFCSILIGVFLCYLFTVWKNPYGIQTTASAIACRIITYTLLEIYLLFIMFFCYRESPAESILCWGLSVSVNTFASVSYSLLLNICGINDTVSISFWQESILLRDYSILIAYHLIIYIIFSFLFARRQKLQQNKQTSINAAILAFSIVFTTYVLGSVSRVYESLSIEMTIITKLFKLVCSVFVMLLAFGVLQRNKLVLDLEITEQVLKQEKKQYEISKQTVEAINMKCHDLKHRLEALENKLNESEIESLKEAIEIYDSNIKTGNQILDVILYEKQLLCNRNSIKLSCMANGNLLNFITPSHLYSLFGNAIDNAIEATMQLDEEEKKIIDLSLSKQNNYALLTVSNYFSGKKNSEDNTPITTKQNRNIHGYGMKSMQYIANHYGGKMETKINGDIFYLKITLPLP